MTLKRFRLALVLMLCWPMSGQAADLRGHGGPVRAIALSPNGSMAVTASFDSTAILWSLERSAALQVLRGHEGVVNAAAFLADGRIATAGEDARILVWKPGSSAPDRILTGHSGPVAALAASPDGRWLASAAWDGTARLWPLDGGEAVILAGHQGNVNGIVFNGADAVVTAGYDGQLRTFDLAGRPVAGVSLGVPLNSIRRMPDGELVVATGEGKVRFLHEGRRADVDISDAPIVALAVSPDGTMVAAAGFRGALALVDRASRRVVRRFEGPAFPLWSLAFSADGTQILTGGSDRLVRRWSVGTGEPATPVLASGADEIPAHLKQHPGADVFKACIACHTLEADGGNRAGPSLAGLYGRRIASAPGYDYSPALRSLPIVWTPDTLQKLFEIGPAAYTPGTKMPEQKILRADDRKALAEFLDLAGRR